VRGDLAQHPITGRDGAPRRPRLQRRQCPVLRLLHHQDAPPQEVHPRRGQPGGLAEPQPGTGREWDGHAVAARQGIGEREHRGGRERLDLARLHTGERHPGAGVDRDHAVIDRGGYHRPYHREHGLHR